MTWAKVILRTLMWKKEWTSVIKILLKYFKIENLALWTYKTGTLTCFKANGICCQPHARITFSTDCQQNLNPTFFPPVVRFRCGHGGKKDSRSCWRWLCVLRWITQYLIASPMFVKPDCLNWKMRGSSQWCTWIKYFLMFTILAWMD